MISRRGLKRGAIGLGAALLLYAIVGYGLVPIVARHQLQSLLSAQLDRDTTIETVRFDPFRLRLAIENLRIASAPRAGASQAETPGAAAAAPAPLFSIARIDAQASWRSLTELAPVISSLQLREPALRTSRDAAGRYAFQDLVERWQQAASQKAQSASPANPDSASASSSTPASNSASTPASSPAPDATPAPPARFSIANIELSDGRVEFDDALHGQQHRVESLQVRIPFLSSLAVDQAIYVEPGIAARINGSAFDLKGKARPFSPNRESTLEVSLADVDLIRYLGYVPVALPVRLAAGTLDWRSTVEFAQPSGAVPSVTIRADATLSAPDLRETNDRPLLKAESVQLAGMVLKPIESSYDVDTVTVHEPLVMVRRLAGDDGWFASLRMPARSPDKAPLRWRVAHLQVQSGLIDYRDEQFRPQPLSERLLNVAIRADGLSSDLSAPVRFTASHDTARNEASAVDGSLRINPFEVEGDAKLFRLKLKDWWWIAQPQLAFTLTDGQLDSNAHFRLSLPEGRADLKLTDLGFHLTQLKLRQRGDKSEFLNLAELKGSRGGFDLAKRRIDVGQVESSNAALELRREADGRLNLAKLRSEGPPSASASAASASAASARSASASAGGGPSVSVPANAGEPQPPWLVTVDKLQVDRYRLVFKDAIAGRAADSTLTDVSLRAEKLSTAPGTRGRVALNGRINSEGQVSVEGPLTLEPLAAKLRVDLKGLSLLPLQPYLAQYLNASLNRGTLQAEGELSVTGASSAGKPTIGFQGALAATDFDIVAKDGRQRVARWQSLRASRIQALSEPLRVAVGDIELKDLQARAVLDAQGRLNLGQLLAARPASTASATAATADTDDTGGAAATRSAASKQAAAPKDITQRLSFEKIAIVNGAVDFSDQFVQPNFRARLTGLNGEVSSMSRRQAGQVSLRGRVNETGQLEVSGQVNPLAGALFLDLQVTARDVEMPGMSPYAQKYIGYGIEKGKLSAQLKYTLKDRVLQAENHVILNQLTFGARVDSPSAIKAPVLFAVSLLKDRNGVIDLNLPVQGTLDDPKFSIGAVVLQAIGNLVVKAASAPFSMIAGLAGRSPEELSKVEFAPGAARLGEDAHARLKAVARALEERPALKVDLAGHVDPERDAEAIRQRRLERMLKREKLKDTAGGAGGEPLEKVTLSPIEFERYLRRAFEAAALERPRDDKGKPQEPTLAQMQSLLADKVTVSDSDLSALANARAVAAKQWLQTEGGIDGERLFVVTGDEATREPSSQGSGPGGEPPAHSGQAAHDAGRLGAVELKLK